MKYIRTEKPKRERSHIPFRLNLLFFFAFLMLAALVAQLAYLQITNGASFRATIDNNDTATVTGAVPRGAVYDSLGRELVVNKANAAITYTKGVGVTSAQMKKTADNLGKYIQVDVEGMTKRDYADYYLADEDVSKAVLKKLPAAMQKSRDTQAVYAAQVAYAKKHLPDFSDHEKQNAFLFKKMNGATQLTTVYLKSTGVTEVESATVGENLTSMSGVNLGTDWERSYPNGTSMNSIIGTVSTERAGLPEESVEAYLANGYARNDRVGTSYLEKQYENVLKGAKSRTTVEIGNRNNIVSSVTAFAGAQGNNLTLTIDSAFQAKVEEALQAQFKAALANGHAPYADGAYAVAMNPQTGAVLAIAGLHHDTTTGELTDDSLGVLNRSFAMGSVVKPAMVLGALQSGVITTTDNTLPDTPIYLRATPVKKSDYPAGTFSALDATKALEVSSNIYMMRLAMREGNAKYEPNKYLTMDDDIFEKMRGYFHQFGLGLKTGIDLPGEITGQEGATRLNGQLAVGSVLDLSYGNLDTYTLMQEVQYVSTIANNGYRMKPYVVKEINQTLADGSNGPVVSTTMPTVMGKIKNSQAQLDLVKQGMWQVVHRANGFATGQQLRPLNPGVAGKTGTAQSFTRVDQNDPTSEQVETITQSFVGFGAAENPQVAIAVVFPNLSKQTSYAIETAKQIFTDYYALYGVAPQPDYAPTAEGIR